MEKACNHPRLASYLGYRQVALYTTSADMIHAMREPSDILFSVEYLAVFR